MQGSVSRARIVERIADELWEYISDVDWRYEGGGGVSYVRLSAKTVIRWCKVMGWDLPEGTIEHADNG